MAWTSKALDEILEKWRNEWMKSYVIIGTGLNQKRKPCSVVMTTQEYSCVKWHLVPMGSVLLGTFHFLNHRPHWRLGLELMRQMWVPSKCSCTLKVAHHPKPLAGYLIPLCKGRRTNPSRSLHLPQLMSLIMHCGWVNQENIIPV